MTQQAHPFPRRFDDRGHILVLPLDRVLVRIPALAPSATVDRQDGEMLLQGGEDGGPAAVVGGRAVDQHQGRSIAASPSRDLRAIPGGGPRRLLLLIAHPDRSFAEHREP